MPELHEGENTRRNLVRAGLPGSTITGANITWANTVKKPSAADLAKGLKGRTIQDIQRRGKYLILPLSGNGPASFIIHLGMTGRLQVQPQSQEPDPMTRHSFPLEDGRELRFVDGRKFGRLWPGDSPIGGRSCTAHRSHPIRSRFGAMPRSGTRCGVRCA